MTQCAGHLRTHLSSPGLQDISPEAQVHKFMAGLTSEIKTALLLYDFATLDEIIAAVHKVERWMSKPRAAAFNPIPTRLQQWRGRGWGRWTPGGRGYRQSNAQSGRGWAPQLAAAGRGTRPLWLAPTAGRCLVLRPAACGAGRCHRQPQLGHGALAPCRHHILLRQVGLQLTCQPQAHGRGRVD